MLGPALAHHAALRDPPPLSANRGDDLFAKTRRSCGFPTCRSRRTTFGRLAFGLGELFDIQQVLRPPRRPFGRNQVFTADERYNQTVKVHFHASRPGFIEDHTRDAHQDVHPHRWYTHLVKVAFLGKVGLSQVRQRRAEFPQGAIDGSGIRRVGANPEIQVFGVSWFGVLNQRIAADDQVFNLLSLELYCLR